MSMVASNDSVLCDVLPRPMSVPYTPLILRCAMSYPAPCALFCP